MALDIDQSHYNTGTAAVSGTAVTGIGTSWLGAVRKGDLYGTHKGSGVRIASVNSNTSLTLAYAVTALNQTNAPYEIQRTPYDVGYLQAIEDQIRLYGEGNLPGIAALTGNGVVEFIPGGIQLVPKEDLIDGVHFDAQVDLLADRAAYNGAAPGFAVLVSNAGAGRAAVYVKASATSGDWSDPAYITGPVGAASTVPGVIWRGAYSGATVYAINDGVTFNGSSFRKLTTAVAGTAPSNATPPVNTAAWEVLAAKGADGSGTGDVAGPAAAVDGADVVFSGPTGKLLKSAGFSAAMNSVSPIIINMHFGTLLGVGWTASDPGGVVSTTTTNAYTASNFQINVASVTGFAVGMLITYQGTDSLFYSAKIVIISGLTLTLDRNLQQAVALGAGVYNFYNNDAHPNPWGYNCLVDDAIRQMSTVRTLAYANAAETQWTAFGVATLTAETTINYLTPGSSVVGKRAMRVGSNNAGAGAVSRAVTLDGGSYETELVLNPGTRTGPATNIVDVNVIATYPDGSTAGIAYHQTTVFGDTIRTVSLKYRVPRGTSVVVRITSPNAGPWTFHLGLLRHYKVDSRIRDFNKGKHVVFGDSWAAGGNFVARLAARLPQATIVNKGVSGNTTTQMASRCTTDVAPENPNYVWVLGGTNDVYAQTAIGIYQANIDYCISQIQAMNAVPIVFDVSVCSAIYAPAPGPRLDYSRQYALSTEFSNGQRDQGALGDGTYTPAWAAQTTNPVLGNGTLIGQWTKVGKVVTCSIALTIGSTTTTGSGTWYFGLPEPAANGTFLGGQGVFGLDSGVSLRAGLTRANTATTVAIFDIATLSNWSGTVPHTWNTGDQLNFTLVYQAAS